MSRLLQRLTSHLLDSRQCRREDIDSWIDRCTLIPEARYEGHYSQLHLDHNTCTVFIERFSGNADLLKAQITSVHPCGRREHKQTNNEEQGETGSSLRAQGTPKTI